MFAIKAQATPHAKRFVPSRTPDVQVSHKYRNRLHNSVMLAYRL